MYKKQTKKSHSNYSNSFKQKVVEDVLSGRFTKEQVRKIYGIKGKSEVLNWIRKFEKQGKNCYETSNITNFVGMKKTLEEQRLLEELLKIKELLRIAELKAELWHRAIEIAEEQFEIDIVKKFGAQALRQLKNKNHK